MKKLILVVILLLFSPPLWAATTYYVATDGNNGNVGSEVSPWLDIHYGQGQLDCGDTLEVADGTYTADEDTDLVVFDDGQVCSEALGWITIRSTNLHGAILDGSDAGAATANGFVFQNNQASFIRLENFEVKNINWGVRINSSSENGNNSIYLYRLKIHDADAQGIITNSYTAHLTVDSCVIYNIYGREWETARPAHYWYHNHNIYLKGKDAIIQNNIFYQGEGSALRIDGYEGTAPDAYSALVVNNTFYGIKEPYPNPLCCLGGSPVPIQTGLINIFAVPAITDVSTLYIENNVFIDPPGENSGLGYGVGIVISDMGTDSCADQGHYDQSDTYIRNNVTNVADLFTRNANCATGPAWAAYSNNIEGADLSYDITDYENYIFTLKSGGSNLIDKGLATNAPALDFAGEARPKGTADDIGAYEYGLAISGASPADGMIGVALDADLTWTPPDAATTMDIYFKPSTCAAGCDTLIDGGGSAGDTTDYDPGTMTKDAQYCYQVDIYHAGPSSPETGSCYDFTTTGGPPPPVAGKASMIYDAGGAGITIDAGGLTIVR